MNRFLLWIAQGFGIGRIPVAPGTFGSAAGFLWFLLLLSSGSLWFLLAGAMAGLALSIWLGAKAEQILSQKDPPSVVLDEIIAIPLCFAGCVGTEIWKTGSLPSPDYFVSHPTWLITAGVLVAFRFFDVIKPWPIRQSQILRAGWGITADDVLAAVYVNLTWLAASLVQAVLRRGFA